MTKKHDLKWALELAIVSMKNPDANWDRKYLAKAADMLKNGGPVVEKTLDLSECGGHKVFCCGETFHGNGILKYKTKEILSIGSIEMGPTYEPAKK